MIREIIEIDEEKCTGCGLCIPGCAEGALAIVNGKAKIVRDMYCDGLGACIGHCPEGALRIVQREADPFDEEAAMEYVRQLNQGANADVPESGVQNTKPRGCPSAQVIQMSPCAQANTPQSQTGSNLGHWPVQIRLVPPHAPFLQDADLLIVGDCCAVAAPDFHSSHLVGKVVLMGCPKFDNAQEYIQRLSQIFAQAQIKSITVLEMEVPCCSGLSQIVAAALANSGKDIPCARTIVTRSGQSVADVMPKTGLLS
ncbi:MAG: 4Fe-4S binding protein [Desulfomicrobium sp.]|nr:4Fe-4S binding protein [Desulfomicrobium sp.]NLV95853.1 4Fe-4S binding protein [Desulfovibrionales bacterium]